MNLERNYHIYCNYWDCVEIILALGKRRITLTHYIAALTNKPFPLVNAKNCIGQVFNFCDPVPGDVLKIRHLPALFTVLDHRKDLRSGNIE